MVRVHEIQLVHQGLLLGVSVRIRLVLCGLLNHVPTGHLLVTVQVHIRSGEYVSAGCVRCILTHLSDRMYLSVG